MSDWGWSYKCGFSVLVPLLICLALNKFFLITSYGSSFLNDKWELLFPLWLLYRDGVRIQLGGSYESALEKLEFLHECKLLLMKRSLFICLFAFLRQSFALVAQAEVQWHNLGLP